MVNFDVDELFPHREQTATAQSAASKAASLAASSNSSTRRGTLDAEVTLPKVPDVDVSLAPVDAQMLAESNVNFILKHVENESEWAKKINKICRLKCIWMKFMRYRLHGVVDPDIPRYSPPSLFREAETLLLIAIQRDNFLP